MATRKKNHSLTFEEGISQIEAIIAQMEHNELTLDESIQAYENGMALYQRLMQMLNEGEARMDMVNAQGDRHEGVQSTVFEVES